MGLAISFSKHSGLHDFCTYPSPCLISMSSVFQGAFIFCQLDIYITDYHFLDTMLIFMLYGWSVIPLMYLLSFLFNRSTSAYIKLILFNYLSGIFSILIDATFQFGKSKGLHKTFLSPEGSSK